MIFKIGDIVRDVRIAIDENKRSEQLIATEDMETLSLDEIARSKIADAVRMVHTEAPREMLESGHNFVEDTGKDFYIGDDGSGFVLLPEDFMRLLIFKMSDWERPVYEPITAADPRYQLQFSRCRGIRGNPQRPVAAIVRRSEGKVLEFYSSKDGSARVEQAAYIPYPVADGEWIDISEECYRAAVYRAAALTLATLGSELAGSMTELSSALLARN